jgi:catechol 2,3-dioxygenase-like lactoylglutathione lyase family enzyme
MLSEVSVIVSLHHAQITIPRGADDECRRFYCDLLGLREVEKPASLQERGGFWLQIGEMQVHVGVEDNVDRQATKAHVAYEVTDLQSWRNRLEQEGIHVLDGIPIPGYDRFEFRDPFGNRVEFLQRI